jgi:amidase
MTAHHFTPAVLHNTIGSHSPALTIASGDTVTAATADAHGFDHRGIKIGERPNPMTGPSSSRVRSRGMRCWLRSATSA